ncbi:sulfotransferase family 2 domain-containing protein [Vibrio sp. F13]|uniref:sulfotransferase family 2 domain-containing protein n=1 Tax=Vibrio sp. F13 TaxID=2070777 RepID=UPI001481FDB6|nr:sulfotransferase family 2 domain-containing protein [Vibrio sp. F13]
MKPSIAIFALRLIPKKKQYSMLVRAFNYLLDVKNLQAHTGKVLSVTILGGKLTWTLQFDGMTFVPTTVSPNVSILFSIDDILNLSSVRDLREQISANNIEVIGCMDDQRFILQLVDSLEQLKFAECLRRLHGLLGSNLQPIEKKTLSQLTLSDLSCAQDIDYLRDQAIQSESFNPALAYQLMLLANTARPKGPFIKRKLNQYRTLGYDRLLDSKHVTIKVIPVSPELSYFPVPKAACSSIKTALYEQKESMSYDKERYNGIHVHDYWSSKMIPLGSTEKTVIVVRDPIERFLSAYASRVNDHHELNYNSIKRTCPWLETMLPNFNPNLSQFIRHFEHYLLVPTIEHHCQPLSWLIDHNLEQFSEIIPLEKIDRAQILIQDATSSNITIPKAHVGKSKVSLGMLTEEQLNKLLKFYADDYVLLDSLYSVQSIREKWLLSRAQKQNQNTKLNKE